MDKFEQKEMMKKRPLSKNLWNDWYDWLLNEIPDPIKMVGGVKDKIMAFLKQTQHVSAVYRSGKKPKKTENEKKYQKR